MSKNKNTYYGKQSKGSKKNVKKGQHQGSSTYYKDGAQGTYQGTPAKGGNGRSSASSKDMGQNIPMSQSGGVTTLEKSDRNDYSWISRSPLCPLAYSIQYNKIPGYIYDHTGIIPQSAVDVSPLKLKRKRKADGGILRLNFVPVLGDTISSNSPVNQSFTTLYSRLIQAVNSGNVGFNQATLSKMEICLIDLVGQIAHITRVLHLINKYERGNGFYPRAILESMGYDYETLKNNKPLYEARLETLILNFNRLGVPEYSDLFSRQVQMNYNVYHDEDAKGAMPFYFMKEGYYWYNFTDQIVSYSSRPSYEYNEYTLADDLSVAEDCLEKLRNTDDLGLVLAAIRRAFPESSVCLFPTYDDKAVLEFGYDRDVIYEVNNAFILPVSADNIMDLNISEIPEVNVVVQKPRYSFDANPGCEYLTPETFILNCYDYQPGDQFAGCATWYLPVLRNSDEAGWIDIVSSRTELLTRSQIFSVYLDDDQKTKLDAVDFHSVMYFSDLAQAAEVVEFLSKYKYAPRIYICGANQYVSAPIGDYQLVTTISSEQVQQTHLAALQSLYILAV